MFQRGEQRRRNVRCDLLQNAVFFANFPPEYGYSHDDGPRRKPDADQVRFLRSADGCARLLRQLFDTGGG